MFRELNNMSDDHRNTVNEIKKIIQQMKMELNRKNNIYKKTQNEIKLEVENSEHQIKS